MISYLEGKIILKRENYIILNVNNIGFKIFLSNSALNKIPQKTENLKVFIFESQTKKGINLYGFLTFKELEIFEKIENIIGIGPKAALEISSIDISVLKEKIKKGDISFLTRVSGIGLKKAKKIAFEISNQIFFEKEKINKEDPALKALVNLGFSQKEAREALDKIPLEIKLEERIKKALQILGKKKS